MTAFDEVGVAQHGRLRARRLSSCWYTAQSENAINKRFVATTASTTATTRAVRLRHVSLRRGAVCRGIEALKGKVEDKQAFIKALRAVRVDTLRGPIQVRTSTATCSVADIGIRKVGEGRRVGRLL
jgi:branched-chain amino acid transport system substrate-binding protein